MATKTIQKTEIDINIEQIQQQINSIKQQIQNSEQDLKQYQKSLDLINSEFTEFIQQGVLQPLDALQNIIDNEQTEQLKQQKIAQIKQALQLSSKTIAQQKTDLIKLESELVKLLQDKDFNDNYLPFVEQFKNDFVKNSNNLKTRIQNTHTELLKHTNNLRIYKIWQQNKEYRLPHNLISNASDNYIDLLENSIIPELQKEYEQLVNQFNNYDVLNDSEFKAWLVQRVNIDFELQELIRLQPLYFQALKNFKQKILDNPSAVNFNIRELPGKLPKVQILNGTVCIE